MIRYTLEHDEGGGYICEAADGEYVRYEEVERYMQVCASAYQLAGLVGAPVRFLDVLGDAANGEIGKRSNPDNLLPVDLNECDGLVVRPEGVLRTLLDTDPYCPSCGHNRDKSAVSSIAHHDGTRSCQMCGTRWQEQPLPQG